MGLDRVDSSKGYEESNIVPCCKVCNRIKWTLSQEEFIQHIHKISEWQKKKNIPPSGDSVEENKDVNS